MNGQINHAQRRRPTTKQKRDDSIMGTNSSCTVSKRSVEKIYHKDDYGFLRYFVKKFQRRAPLINRGYWLRMRAIERTIHDFLRAPSASTKVIVNLGCGDDPLPFKFLRHEPEACKNAIFIDVDYRQLILKKCENVIGTEAMSRVLVDLVTDPEGGPVVLGSKQYSALACDLEDLKALDEALALVFDRKSACILFVAEVSITYMDTAAADAVIQWTSTMPDARFCLLEQYLPDGPDHPFAQTMLDHFSKLHSPLKSIHKYPTLLDQTRRFSSAGWKSVDVTNLWRLWNNDNFLDPSERTALDKVEPFDEWTEFALFGCHYILLVADTRPDQATPYQNSLMKVCDDGISHHESKEDFFLTLSAASGSEACKHHGALWKADNSRMYYHGGQGSQRRVDTCTVYARADVIGRNDGESQGFEQLPKEELMCHVIVNFRPNDSLLVGGRTSPERASSACYWRHEDHWRKTSYLPHGLFAHCATEVTPCTLDTAINGVMIFGGKDGFGVVQDKWLYWEPNKDWEVLEISGQRPPARFGATMTLANGSNNRGFILGGMTQDGRVLADVWEWTLVQATDNRHEIRCINRTANLTFPNDRVARSFGRYGASLARLSGGYLLIGGIAKDSIVENRDEVIKISENLHVATTHVERQGRRPIYSGFSTANVKGNEVLIVGGGAVCFSFGTCWNPCVYLLSPFKRFENPWAMVSAKAAPKSSRPAVMRSASQVQQWVDRTRAASPEHPSLNIVARVHAEDTMDFRLLVERAQPAVIQGLYLGSCVKKWQDEYLLQKIGSERLVSVHVASETNMNFVERNFRYATMTFGSFLAGVHRGEKLYLRSLSSSKPTQQAAEFKRDFTAIADDFDLPPQLAFASEMAHSSPLRVSGPVTMWLHYDVMANVLCQIRGRRRLLLFAPSDVGLLGFAAGSSSSALDVFASDGQAVRAAAIEATLEPGEVLFIPPLWPHAAQPTTESKSSTSSANVAVNVFFRTLDGKYAAGRDVYANRDLEAYETGRRELERMRRRFDGLPAQAARFYLERLSAELADMAAGEL